MNYSSASDEAMPLRTDEDRNGGENTKEKRASVGLYRWFDLILPCGIIVLAMYVLTRMLLSLRRKC